MECRLSAYTLFFIIKQRALGGIGEAVARPGVSSQDADQRRQLGAGKLPEQRLQILNGRARGRDVGADVPRVNPQLLEPSSAPFPSLSAEVLSEDVLLRGGPDYAASLSQRLRRVPVFLQ